jgi:hypothetical protein
VAHYLLANPSQEKEKVLIQMEIFLKKVASFFFFFIIWPAIFKQMTRVV